MSKINDFFKGKKTRAMTSGAKVDDLKKQTTKNNWKKLVGKVALGVVISSSFVACGPSNVEIEQKVKDTSQSDKDKVALNYDVNLLSKIDSLENAGHSQEAAIEKSHDIAWAEAKANMPENKKEWSGKDFVAQQHAQKRVEDAKVKKTKKVIQEKVISTGGTLMKKKFEVDSVYYVCNKDFKKDLKLSIKEKQQNVKTSVAQKVMQSKMQR